MAEEAVRLRIVATTAEQVAKLRVLTKTVVSLCKANGLAVSSQAEAVAPRRGRAEI
jgi:hypothetical protein